MEDPACTCSPEHGYSDDSNCSSRYRNHDAGAGILIPQIVPGQPVPYDERLGWTKDEYAKYLECWKLKQVQEVAPVAPVSYTHLHSGRPFFRSRPGGVRHSEVFPWRPF